jgi:Skp family chaperone for outer membrane proteins
LITGSSSVAVIDFDRAVAETPAGKEAITKLTALGNEQRSLIEKKQSEAEDLQNRLRAQDRVLSEAARAQLARELETAQSAIQTMGEDAQQKIEKMEQELLVPVQQKTATAVRAYAAEHSYKIVFDASTLRGGLVYVHDTADITTEIIRRIAENIERPVQEKGLADKLVERLVNRHRFDFTRLTANEPAADSNPN